MNRNRSMLFLISMTLFVTSCQSVFTVEPEGEEVRLHSGTLRIALFSGYKVSESLEPYEPGLKEYPIQDKMITFMEKHPNVKIEVVDINPDYHALQTLLDDPSLQPDIIEMNVNEARLTAKDRILSLAEYIDGHALKWDGGYTNVIDSAAIDGEPFLLPVRSNPMLVHYDKSLFEQLGLMEPKMGWTMADFANIATKLIEEGEAVSTPSGLGALEHIIQGWGGEYASADHSQVSGYLDSDDTIDAFVRYVQMMPAIVQAANGRDLPSLGMWRATEMRRSVRSSDVEYSFAPVPSTIDGTRYNTSLLTGLAITKDSKQQDLAWALMQHIVGETSDEALDFVARNTLEVDNRSFRDDENPKIAELREWLKSEAVIATPSTLDMFMARSGNLGDAYPRRTREQMEAYADREAAKKDLTLLAQQLESWMALLLAKE